MKDQKRRAVMVASPDDHDLTSIRRILEKDDIHVISMSRSSAARVLIESDYSHVAALITVPSEDFETLVQVARHKGEDFPILLICREGQEEIAPMDDFMKVLLRPFKDEELLAIAKDFLLP